MDLNQLLKSHGYRATKERKSLLAVLTDRPLTVQEIFDSLPKSKRQDLASVYRNLQLFVELDIVQIVQLAEGKNWYELKETHHHHHLVCNRCGTITDVTLTDENKLLETVTSRTGFKILRHTVEFFGICTECQRN